MQNIRERIRKKGHRMFPCGGFLFAGKRSFGAKKELDNYYTKNGKHSRIVLWKLTNTGKNLNLYAICCNLSCTMGALLTIV